MCLYSKEIKSLTLSDLKKLHVKIATKDIVVYKRLKKRRSPDNETYYVSPNQFFIYEKNVLYKAKLSISKAWFGVNKIKVNEGLHAYRKRPKPYGAYSNHIFKMVIPKGSQYVIGEKLAGHIVSNQLIWK